MAKHAALILGCRSTQLSASERRFFTKAQPWGFCLFGRNLEHADQIAALCDQLRNAVGWDAPIFIDQEGGRVQRLRPPLASDWPAPRDHVLSAGRNALQVMVLRAKIIALELRALGIDGNFAPCVDIAGPDTHPFLANRCLSNDPQEVAIWGRAMAEGFLDAGVLPVIKHIPGHGRAAQDSHFSLPKVTEDLDTLRAHDFLPFRACRDFPLAMSAHIQYEAIDPQPATLSPRVIEVIRKEIGFDGVLMSDDISMEALPLDEPARTRDALWAGCDMVLHCNGDLEQMHAVADIAPNLAGQSDARATRALAHRVPQPALDILQLKDELDAVTHG